MPVAIARPTLEVAGGLGLFFEIEASLVVAAGLLAMFIAVLAYGIWMGQEVDCGCFGPGDPEAVAFHGLRSFLYRDLVMTAGVAFIFGWRRYRAVQAAKKIADYQKTSKKRRT
jgi:hypothetical protein